MTYLTEQVKQKTEREGHKMKTQNSKDVYVTFKTNQEICQMLTVIAKEEGKTQPELIESICKDYIKKKLLNLIEQELNENMEE